MNSCPKAGSHAAMALLDTMGLHRWPGTLLPNGDGVYVEGMPTISIDTLKTIPNNCFLLGHVPARYNLRGFRLITVLRDPRNVLVSYVRHRKREDGLDVTLPDAMEDFWGWGPFVEVYRSFLGWIGRAIVIRYEDMPPHQTGNGKGIYRNHDRDWNTRTGKSSQWTDHWSAEAASAWQKHGGSLLLSQAGYT